MWTYWTQLKYELYLWVDSWTELVRNSGTPGLKFLWRLSNINQIWLKPEYIANYDRHFRYMIQYQEPIPVEQLVINLCDIKQAYTQYGSLRPFGISVLYIGWDKQYGFQLYQSDPSGNYGGWKATCIGHNSQVRPYFFVA